MSRNMSRYIRLNHNTGQSHVHRWSIYMVAQALLKPYLAASHMLNPQSGGPLCLGLYTLTCSALVVLRRVEIPSSIGLGVAETQKPHQHYKMVIPSRCCVQGEMGYTTALWQYISLLIDMYHVSIINYYHKKEVITWLSITSQMSSPSVNT